MEPQGEETFLTTRQAASRLGVNFRTIQNWVEKGILRAWKTAGGHRRIACSSVDAILAQRDNTLNGHAAPPPKQDHHPYRLKVVIVEDEEALRGVYEVYFESWDLPVELLLASNGVEGLLIIGRQKPHVVISDLIMPDMDGFVMLRTLLEDTTYQETRFIVVTRLSDDEIEDYGGLSDRVMVLKKPMAYEQLEPLIRAIVQEVSGQLAEEK